MVTKSQWIVVSVSVTLVSPVPTAILSAILEETARANLATPVRTVLSGIVQMTVPDMVNVSGQVAILSQRVAVMPASVLKTAQNWFAQVNHRATIAANVYYFMTLSF
jgi:hypothetical protein